MAERAAVAAAQRLQATSRSVKELLASTPRSTRPVRPSVAPKPTVDVKSIRQNPEVFAQNCRNRNYNAQAEYPKQIVDLFSKWKDLQFEGRSLREKHNSLRTKLSHPKNFSGNTEEDDTVPQEKEEILQETKKLKDQITEISQLEEVLDTRIEALAEELPNLTSNETPIGSTPTVLEHISEHPDLANSKGKAISHVLIGAELDLLDFTAAAGTSGWGYYFLKNEAALLEQALVQFALSIARAEGFTVISPPSMVYSHISSACGFRPRDQGGEQQVYTISRQEQDEGKPEMSLAGTAEIPFAAMKANTEIEEGDLPLKVVGSSRCYRAEAGGRGADTKGLYRVHEFTKVEMFGWTRPDDSATKIFHQMVSIQKRIFRSLGLHCRVLEQPSYDLGASATRKQDIEAFFPSRRDRNEGWGEVASTSICTDYQTRRLSTRIKRAAGGKMDHAYTVNGTAVAIPRVIAAILENHWVEKEGCVGIPEVLWPWMHGIKVIQKKRKLN